MTEKQFDALVQMVRSIMRYEIARNDLRHHEGYMGDVTTADKAQDIAIKVAKDVLIDPPSAEMLGLLGTRNEKACPSYFSRLITGYCSTCGWPKEAH